MTADNLPPWAVWLRAERERRGWNKHVMARELHKAIGRTYPTLRSLVRQIRGWENGEHFPRDWTAAYATAFRMDEADLFGQDCPEPTLWRPPGISQTLNEAYTPDDEERLLLAVRRPARLDGKVVEALSTVLAGQRRLEDAIGPAALLTPMVTQLDALTRMLRDASGPHRDELGRVVAEWTLFAGWLQAAVRQNAEALALFGCAEDLADDVRDGTTAAIATSFKGYVARQQGRHRGVVRASYAALATPGAHRAQKTFDTLQAAQGYAGLGDRDQARRLLDAAADMAGDAGEPPPALYWYSTPFFLLNIGMVHLALGHYRDAADHLRAGLDGMPADQRDAEWMSEYRDALADAKARS